MTASVCQPAWSPACNSWHVCSCHRFGGRGHHLNKGHCCRCMVQWLGELGPKSYSACSPAAVVPAGYGFATWCMMPLSLAHCFRHACCIGVRLHLYAVALLARHHLLVAAATKCAAPACATHTSAHTMFQLECACCSCAPASWLCVRVCLC